MTLKYRPEIDGLRCIAVMLVILHHLDVPGFSGGFIGVDVFFVISGYLITGILLAELNAGAFSFGDFYKRRILRLAPAYFLVLFVTSAFAWFLMLPVELVNFSYSALYSTFFAANFYMWHSVGGYFGVGADTTPLLHLWSLAVEEQFYVIWPVIFLLLYKVFRSGKHTNLVVLILLVLCLIISEFGALNYRSAAYYLMPTRAFELLLGSTLALTSTALIVRVPKWIHSILALTGITMILYASIFFTKDTWFPGLSALYPCVGALFLIAFTRRESFIGSLLASKAFVGIGKVSYPAYLWHWPIIALIHLHLIELTPLVCIAVIVCNFVLAAMTYQFIEKPVQQFRNNDWRKVVASGFGIPAVLLVAVTFSAIYLQGFPKRFDEELNSKSEAVSAFADVARGRCNEGPVSAPLGPDACLLGVNKPKVDFLLVGDSHANHFTGMVDVLASDAGLRGYDVTQSATPFLINLERFYLQDKQIVLDKRFNQRNSMVSRELLKNNYSYVILGGAFPYHYMSGLFSIDTTAPERPSQAVFQKAMTQTISEIIRHGSVPILLKGAPVFDFDVARCTLNNARFGLNKACHMTREKYKEQFRLWSKFLDELHEKFNQLVVIDPALVMCDESSCYSDLFGTPLYKDSSHLNYEGSKLVGRLYLEKFGNPFFVDKATTAEMERRKF